MRCRACNNPLSDTQQWFFSLPGVQGMIPETLCTKCLSTIRTQRSKWEDGDEDISLILGTTYVETFEEG